MWTKAVLFFVALSASGVACASKCDAPPYGDSWKSYISKMSGALTMQEQRLEESADMVNGMFKGSCMAKFEGNPHAIKVLHSYGITDQTISTASTGDLAFLWLNGLMDASSKVAP